MNTQRVEGHTPTLLPCPFCGGTDIVIANKQEFEEERDWDDGYRTYICDASDGHTGCGGSCGFMPSEELARQRWNSRASIERLEKVNEALVAHLEKAERYFAARNLGDTAEALLADIRAGLSLAKEPA